MKITIIQKQSKFCNLPEDKFDVRNEAGDIIGKVKNLYHVSTSIGGVSIEIELTNNVSKLKGIENAK